MRREKTKLLERGKKSPKKKDGDISHMNPKKGRRYPTSYDLTGRRGRDEMREG